MRRRWRVTLIAASLAVALTGILPSTLAPLAEFCSSALTPSRGENRLLAEHRLRGLLLRSAHAYSATTGFSIPARPDGYVTDKAGMLSPQTRSQLEAGLADFERKTSTQIVVATFPSLDGESLEDVSIRLAEKWKIGQKGKDNGVIFLIFKDDRKMRIEVGYGLEGTLPDALAGQIIQNEVAPAFRAGNYEQGIIAGVQGIAQAVQGEYRNESRSSGQTPDIHAGPLLILILIIVAVISAIDLFRYGGYAAGHRGQSKSYTFWEWWFRFAILLFILNLLFRIAYYSILFSGSGRGGRSGGFSGGGFSGGGGGSFGGGGSSGSW